MHPHDNARAQAYYAGYDTRFAPNGMVCCASVWRWANAMGESARDGRTDGCDTANITQCTHDNMPGVAAW